MEELLSKDYRVGIVLNAGGELCSSYPPELFILEAERHAPADQQARASSSVFGLGGSSAARSIAGEAAAPGANVDLLTGSPIGSVSSTTAASAGARPESPSDASTTTEVSSSAGNLSPPTGSYGGPALLTSVWNSDGVGGPTERMVTGHLKPAEACLC